MEKQCTKCGDVKGEESFCKSAKGRGGLAAQCKECNREYRIKNRDMIVARRKRYRAERGDFIRANDREYYRKNAEKIKAYSAQYYRDNKADCDRKSKEWRAKTGAGKAIGLVRYYVSKGIIPSLTKNVIECVDCGKRATEYDHRDYNKPLDVEPVCNTCNRLRGPAKRREDG